MLSAWIRTALRLAVTVVMAIAVMLAPGGTSKHHDPAALAEAWVVAASAMPDDHGHVHEEPDGHPVGSAGSHEHDAADHAHDKTVLPGGIAVPPNELRARWVRLPPLQRWTKAGRRLDRPPRDGAAA